MDFEWDPAKDATNFEKHGVDFDYAIGIFESFTLECEDDRRDYGETRLQVIGETGGHILLVVLTVRGSRLRSFPRARRGRVSDDDISKPWVRRSLTDPSRPKGRFRATADEAIDTSDIAELDAAFWENARLVEPRTRPTVTMRVSPEVKAYFQAQDPKGYTTRMAAILEAYVKAKSAA